MNKEASTAGTRDARVHIVIWGAAGHGLVLFELISRRGGRVAAFVDNDPSRRTPVEGVPVLHGISEFERWLSSAPRPLRGLVAIGGARGRERLELGTVLESHGVELTTAVHPTAFCAEGVEIGNGSQILAMSALAAGSRVGPGCIVNTSASVDHECTLGEGVHIGPGAHLAGEVQVEARAFIGAGAVILPRVRVGSDAVVGAGSVVLGDVPRGAVVAGNPARVLRR